MCFSATASFSAAALLIPAGAFCLKKSNQVDRRYWAYAMLPLLFGIQQALEGGIWLSLLHAEQARAHGLALGFLLFSHVFWLGWIPYSSFLTEGVPRLRRLFLGITAFGLLFGASMYLPLLYQPGWMQVAIVNHAIDYELRFVSDTYLPQSTLTAVYAAVILVPLMLSSDRGHSILGVLVLLSGLATWAFFDWVFISVWCYFAALISMYIFYMIARSVQDAQLARATG